MNDEVEVRAVRQRSSSGDGDTKRPMAVHVTSVHSWTDTRVFQRMCCGLARRGWGVVLVAANAPSNVVDGVRVRGVRVPRTRLLRALIGGLSVTLRAALIRADLYQIHDPELLVWSWILRLKGTPVVFDMHEHLPSAIMTKTWIPKRVRPFVRASWGVVERVTLGWCAVVFAELSYAKHYPWARRFATVQNLPDLEVLLKIASSDHKADLVYMGRVGEGRGSLVVLKALEIIRRSGHNVTYVCLGSASSAHADELRAAIGQMGLSSVELLGYMQPKDAWAIAKGCRIGLAVLKPEPNYLESIPTKMYEYMALGLPVILSDFPLYREVVSRHQCGLCVDPGDPDDLAAAILQLLGDPQKAREMGERGRQAVVRNYDWEHQLDHLVALYANCGVHGRETDVLGGVSSARKVEAQ